MKPDGFSLDQFLRYGICGVTLISAALYAARGDFTLFESTQDEGLLAAITVVAFVCGAALYSIYRALAYPALGRVALYLVLRRKPRWRLRHLMPCALPAAEFVRDCKRWKRGAGKEQFAEWASQVHLLYTTGFSLWAGSIAGVSYSSTWSTFVTGHSWDVSSWILAPATLCIVSAFCADIRRRRVEEHFPADEKA